ncbi:hypothetical protein ABIF15_008400 [Bradyrhizobium elkanii]
MRHNPGDQEHETEGIGQEQRTRHRLAEQDDSAGEVEHPEQKLPHESTPTLGPEGVQDFEPAGNDGGPADKDGADHGEKHDVSQNQKARGDHDEAEQNADP